MKSGDESVSQMFAPFIWKEHGLGSLLDKFLSSEHFENNLKLILIKFYVQGKFGINGPEGIKVGKYSNKKREIHVEISVTPENFHNKDEFGRREFVLDNTLNAVKLVKEKLKKRKLDLEFDKLISEINLIGRDYLKYTKVINPRF